MDTAHLRVWGCQRDFLDQLTEAVLAAASVQIGLPLTDRSGNIVVSTGPTWRYQ